MQFYLVQTHSRSKTSLVYSRNKEYYNAVLNRNTATITKLNSKQVKFINTFVKGKFTSVTINLNIERWYKYL